MSASFPHFLGERVVLSASGHRGRIEFIVRGGVYVYDETIGEVLPEPLRPEDIERETPESFAMKERSLYHIPMLEHLPCAALLRLDDEWRFCCHGRFDRRLVECGLAPLETKIARGTTFLYETTTGYSTIASEARRDDDEYEAHVTKWGDIAENVNGSFSTSDRRWSRPVMTVDVLDYIADTLGLADRYALVSGHQDLVNCAYGHRHKDGTRLKKDPLISADEWQPSTTDGPYYDMLTTLRLTERLANPFPLEYQRFIVTSSAYYSKRETTPYLGRTCWLSLAQGNMLVHHASPKPLDGPGVFGAPDTLDDASFWQIVDHAVNVVKYPNEAGAVPTTSDDWRATRFFSTAYVSSVFHATRTLLERDVPSHSVAYQIVRAEDDALVVFVGDLHSSIRSLGVIVDWCRQIGCFEVDEDGQPTARLRPNVYLIFLGDLIDRGPFGVEILVIASLLKLATPAQVILLNGNHEDVRQYNKDGMGRELRGEYSDVKSPGRDARTTTTS